MTRTAPALSRAETAEVRRRQRGRNLAMLLVLLAVVVLFYLITLAKLAGTAAVH